MRELEFKPNLVKRLAVMHEGNAAAHLDRIGENFSKEGASGNWSQAEMIGASSLVISASLWSMINAARAVRLYSRATIIYRQLNHSYWLPLAIVSASEKTSIELSSALRDTSALNAQAVAFGLVFAQLYRQEDSIIDRLRQQWKHLGNIPIGRLGIPLDHYGECAEAMREARNAQRTSRFVDAASSYIGRASEILRSASHDRFHWQALQSSILPAEPEAVAMTTAMSIVAHRVLHSSISELPAMDRYGRFLVQTGERMRKAISANRS